MSENRPDTRTVLVVDDHEDIRELLSWQLQARGCKVVEAGNGREAVELAPQIRPDLILMDLSMPVLDGYEATRQLRGRQETRDVPVVAVSAFCDADNRRKALDAGCVECVSKPVDFSLLDGLLSRHLH
jgi:two-component system, cell cycle response regulator DivK